MTKLSVVVPVYRCAESLDELHAGLRETLSRAADDYEIIFVNDGSPDRAWEVIKALAARDPRVKGLRLSRNFGQHYALTAGFHHATGDYVATMDCDLQDDPAMLPALLAKARSGFDIVYGVAPFRSRTSLLDRLFSRLFYRLYDCLSDNTHRSANMSFLLMSRKAADAFNAVPEKRRQFFTIVQYLGFATAEVDVVHRSRPHGRSSYGLRKRMALARSGIVAGSTKLLRLGIYAGTSFAALSILFALFIVVRKLSNRDFAAGWPSVITAIFFVGGVILLVLGILGLYLESVFYETKGRPLYIVDETVNLTGR
jgi:glycosyltransferase involved in cell wall biosynthesis